MTVEIRRLSQLSRVDNIVYTYLTDENKPSLSYTGIPP